MDIKVNCTQKVPIQPSPPLIHILIHIFCSRGASWVFLDSENTLGHWFIGDGGEGVEIGG